MIEDTLKQLISIPSVSSDLDQCDRVVRAALDLLGTDHGLHVTRLQFDGVPCAIVGTRPDRHAQLILNAHLDVVPARDHQFTPRQQGNRLEGRGSYDMKGAAAVYIELLREIAQTTPDRRPDLQVQFVTDEEVGGHLGARCLLREGYTGDFFIAGEPTDMGICHRAKGILWLTVRLSGSPGHAARPWETSNPLLALQTGLQKILQRFPAPVEAVWRTTATPTALHAGDAHNRVPQEAVLKLDVRRVPQDSDDEIIAFVQQCFPQATIDIAQRGDVLDTSPEHEQVRRVAALCGPQVRFYSEHYGSDARYYSARGIPAICWGPCGGGMHSDDEWVDLDSLHLYHRALRRLVGYTD